MSWLDEVPNKQIQFENRVTEERIRTFCKDKNEIFAGLLLKVNLRSCRELNLAKIHLVIPFPNQSKNPEHNASPTWDWATIMTEIKRFYCDYDREGWWTGWLGWLHSHPNGKNEFSPNDFNFGKYLSSSWNWNGHFMFLVTWYGGRRFGYLCKYVTRDTIEDVLVRSFFKSPRAL